MSRWALVPIKSFDRGKSRLSEVLGQAERAELARGLFEHVVRVLRASPDIDAIAAVSDSAQARELAEGLGALALADAPGSRGLAEVVDGALEDLKDRGATSVLICMSDLPELTVDGVARVVRQLEESDVVLVPDLAQRGTNVIAVKPATALPSCLGHEDSLDRHHACACRLGLTVRIQISSTIGFDVDRPSDLDRLRRR
ncbi:MAG: 2-phospho-L-lactate guanylyltransferase [Myxococcales bacterium]|nr:2-phospho-L-lactate guanylyltransferase [Deltaproteobacteria bacterium]NND29610.1 2-phospho-L-lactate guanylyltransferase [Myxococcales bacterium]MBT8482394.1 2-phospho-L-lactate guanylyltransferase [Deltaproteobacteria bacterium]NNK08698.1 2-phospho-L-lactate guanylyltransferase [Myxococcales bacterium]NNK43299.1 2-phospho-L-lactate guanylyltransferase [Myxococcales bacterium]